MRTFEPIPLCDDDAVVGCIVVDGNPYVLFTQYDSEDDAVTRSVHCVSFKPITE